MTGRVPVDADQPSEGCGFERVLGSGLLAALSVGAALAAAGCGGSGTPTAASTGATPPSPAASTSSERPTAHPATAPSIAPPPASATGGSGGGSEPIRVPAVFIFTRAGRVDPPTVTIPALVPVQLTLVSRDGRSHTLVLRGRGRAYALRVPAGGRASERIPGLPAGRYPLSAAGGGPGAALIAGGQVGP